MRPTVSADEARGLLIPSGLVPMFTLTLWGEDAPMATAVHASRNGRRLLVFTGYPEDNQALVDTLNQQDGVHADLLTGDGDRDHDKYAKFSGGSLTVLVAASNDPNLRRPDGPLFRVLVMQRQETANWLDAIEKMQRMLAVDYPVPSGHDGAAWPVGQDSHCDVCAARKLAAREFMKGIPTPAAV